MTLGDYLILKRLSERQVIRYFIIGSSRILTLNSDVKMKQVFRFYEVKGGSFSRFLMCRFNFDRGNLQ